MEEPIFVASTANVNHIYRVLRAISLVSKEAAITISDQGIRVSVDQSRVCHAHLFLTASLFSTYKFKPPADSGAREDGSDAFVHFNVSLTALISCLQLYATEPAGDNSKRTAPRTNSDEPSGRQPKEMFVLNTCSFVYRGAGQGFSVSFKEGTTETDCHLTTYERGWSGEASDGEDDEDAGIFLALDQIVQKIIMPGPILEDLIKELETTSTNVVTIVASARQAPYLKFISQGDVGASEIVLPNEKSVLETFIVSEPGAFYDETYDEADQPNVIVQNSYQFNLVNLAREAVHWASRVSIRCDVNGVMSMQSMCEFSDGKQSFIDFRFLPIEE